MRSVDFPRIPHRLFFAGLSLTCALTSSAAIGAADWTSAQRIQEVVVDDSFTTVIIPPINNPMGCGVPTFLRIHRNDANYASMAAAILSAQAQGKTVRLFAAGCHADNSVRITGIWIQPQ